MTFAHHPGEDPEQTAEHVVALEVELAGVRQRGELENEKLVLAELERITGQRRGRQTRAGASGD